VNSNLLTLSGPFSPTACWSHSQWCFQKHNSDPLVEKITHDLTAAQQPRYLVCRACKQKITSTENRIAINGQHHHLCVNPSGFMFEIGCFAWAEHCIHQGVPTLEYTWFKGYRWCLALCARCYVHLGWYYQNGEHFYGFILAQLEEQNG